MHLKAKKTDEMDISMKYVLGFSGGVDSQACAYHMLSPRGLNLPKQDVILLNSQAGRNEHPITVEHIKWYSENVHPVIEVVPQVRDIGQPREGSKRTERRKAYHEEDEMTFEIAALLNGGFLSRRAQWCTEYLKQAPTRRWCHENLTANGIEYEMYFGVRCDESDARANTEKRAWHTYYKCWVNYPIRCWTKMECFAVLKSAGEEVNPLYKLGFGRVGCAPCINNSKDDVREWAARLPDMIDKVREWERSVGKAFFAPCVPGMEINWVDDVVAWSKTARGGRQPLFAFVENDAADGVCSSKYGLCE